MGHIKSWFGKDRRRESRRAEDLKRCVFCDIHFSWASSSAICNDCSGKLTVLHKHKGSIVDIHA
jgi:hypothetical protein